MLFLSQDGVVGLHAIFLEELGVSGPRGWELVKAVREWLLR